MEADRPENEADRGLFVCYGGYLKQRPCQVANCHPRRWLSVYFDIGCGSKVKDLFWHTFGNAAILTRTKSAPRGCCQIDRQGSLATYPSDGTGLDDQKEKSSTPG